jgi:hypothetical protein
MFIHHVFFYTAPDADLAALRAGLETLTPIEGIKTWHIGVPAATNRSVIERGYAYSWLLTFENADDQEVYQGHPLHLAFIEKCAHLWHKVLVYDSV